jgi:hypothetical protein
MDIPPKAIIEMPAALCIYTTAATTDTRAGVEVLKR